jgi:hypothetical protein
MPKTSLDISRYLHGMSAAGDTAGKRSDARKAWASALKTLLQEGAWHGGVARPADLPGCIEVFAVRLKVRAGELNAPDRAIAPGNPRKAIETWLDGRVPFAKAFGALGLALFGDNFEKHEGYQRLRVIWVAAGKSPKGSLLDTVPPTTPARPAPDTMTQLGWAPVSAWQTTGLAELIIGHPQFRNDRDGYRMTVSVSFGPDRFTLEGHQFSARLRGAWLEPEYHNCHPVPGSRPGDTIPHPNVEILGGRYHFRGPKPDQEYLAGNPVGTRAAEDATDVDDPSPSTVPFAEIAWNRPGANSVRLTLSSLTRRSRNQKGCSIPGHLQSSRGCHGQRIVGTLRRSDRRGAVLL